MKKIIIALFIVLLTASPIWAAATKMYGRDILIGGTKSVDNIPDAGLVTGDLCIVITAAKVTYFYRFNNDSAVGESVPEVIAPDDAGGNGRWELVPDIPTANTIGGSYIYRDSGTDVPVADGGTGVSDIGDYFSTHCTAAVDNEADWKAAVNLEAGTDYYDIAGSDAADVAASAIDATYADTVVTTALGTSYNTEAELVALMSITQTVTVATANDLTFTAGYKWIDAGVTFTGVDPAIVGFSETGAINNAIGIVQNKSAFGSSWAWESGVFEHSGGAGKSILLGQGQILVVQYQTDRWIELFTTGTHFFSSISVPAYAIFADADAQYNDTATPTVLLDSETKSSILTSYGAGEDWVFTMPAYTFGMNFMVHIGPAFQVDLEPPVGDNIVLNGLAAANDEHIVNDSDTEYDVMSCYTVEESDGSYQLVCNTDNANFAEATPP